MAEFFDREAEVSEGSEDEEVRAEVQKRKKTKSKQFIDDDSDEDDDDDDEVDADQLRREMADLIDDNEEEEDDDQGSNAGSDGKRSREDDDDLEDDLDEEDLELLEENLGYKVPRKKKLKRVRIDDDDEEEGGGDGRDEENEREMIANELFDDDDEEQPTQQQRRREDRDIEDRFARISDEESESDDENDFIVDDDDQPIRKKGKKRSSHRYADEAFQQAQEIFGVDFDFDDLQEDGYDEYGSEGEEEEEEEEEEEISEEDENGERVTRIVKVPRKGKRRAARKSIFELYEPVELEKSHLTEKDEEIRKADIPERFQLRHIPVTSCEEEELYEEAQWIYKNAFNTPTISIQSTEMGEVRRDPVAGRKDQVAIPKIANALRNIRNHLLEVPFIAFYRKEHIEPELGTAENDISELMDSLWHIYHWDEKWCQLQERKKNLVNLFKQMQTYLKEKIERSEEPDKTMAMYREITEQDIERVQEVTNFDELRDCWVQFQLYYAAEVEPMREDQKQRDRQRRIDEALGDQDQIDRILAEEHEDIRRRLDKMKVVPRKDTYTVCKEAGILGFASEFGLTPEQFGENLRDNYQRHEVKQCPIDPFTLASDFKTNRFQKEDVIIQAAKFMVAKQLSCDPLVRKVLRQVYFERARVKARPTKKGKKEIDESHPCFTYKYLINKPVTELAKDQFLNLMTAQKEGLMDVRISVDPESSSGEKAQSYFDEIKNLYSRDEFASNVEQWNKLREEALKLALDKFLYPSLEKELKSKLLHEVHQEQIKAACRKLRDWISVAPYRADDLLTEFEDFDTRDGLRIMGFAFSPSNEFPAYAAMIDGEGEVTDSIRLSYFTLKIHTEIHLTDQERDLRAKDRRRLKEFILEKKPHVIVIGADSVLTRKVKESMENLIRELVEEDPNFPQLPIELMSNDVANVYMNSKKAQQDLHEVNAPLFRQAVSLARRLQDPLIEFSQLCTSEEELLCLRFCDFQDQLPKDELLTWLYQEIVNRVNEVGVDVNRAMAHPHTANLLQFVGGFGPRKSAYFYRCLKKKSTPLLESRTQLVTDLNLGAKIFINCAGFIKIDVMQLQAAANETIMDYIEILDSTRVHPEAYEWARKMAVDALEYDEENHDDNQASAIEEIMENPEKLKDLDLDAFAVELERQGFGKRHITLYDIRNELTHRYKDRRKKYTSPTEEDIFMMLTKETPKTFYPGKLVVGEVVGIYRKRPTERELNETDINPVRNEDGTWSCPYCKRADFAELNEVWSHFDTGDCQGQPVGIRIRLDNGIVGICETKNLSDKEVLNPEDRVNVGMSVHARVTRILPEKFSCNFTCKSSDLNDKFNNWRPPKDVCYDYEAEDEDTRREEELKKKQQKQPYFKRIIVHPSFQNIDFKTAEKMLASMSQGEAIIRPSSKGSDHLTLTWKVHDGINQHVDIKEEQKDNAFSLGRQLFIHGECYEDLDEIIARFVNPMAANARELINYKYFQDAEGGKRDVMERLLMEEKRKAPNKIHYFISACKDLPGKFLLSYLPRNTVRHEFITITPEGFRYRQQIFRSVNQMMRWFKEHFREPPPQTPRPTPAQVRTPGSFVGTPIDPNALRRAASSITSDQLNSLARATGHSGQTPSGYGLSGTPNAGQPLYRGYGGATTPHLTPGYGASGTPRNYQGTPSQQQWAGSMGPPSSRAPVSRSTPRQHAAGAAWGTMMRGDSGSGWQQPPGQSRNTPRGTPGTSGYNSKTPLYATPGASSHMSISPTQTPNFRNDTPMNDDWNM